MARNNDRGGSSRRAPKDAGRRLKKKPCSLCKDRVEWVDYKDVALLRKFMSDRGKIRARRVSGNCTQHQRDVAIAIKTARELVLLPYTQRTTTERPGGRRGGFGGGGRRGRDGDRGAPTGESRSSEPRTGDAPASGEGAATAEGAPSESAVDTANDAAPSPDGQSAPAGTEGPSESGGGDAAESAEAPA